MILHFFWILFQLLIGYNLVLPMVLFIIHKIVVHSKANEEFSNVEYDYAIIVTAYEQLDTIPAVVKSLLKLNYSNYLIYIVADKCDVSTLAFANENVIVLRPPETLASNTRSHFYAINNFKRNHQRLTIIDSDNLVDPNYLSALDVYFAKGFEAVQGIRNAKNLNTTYACLDAARDIYYHFYDGQLLFQVGSSATLAGSGMAFNTSLYKNCLENLDVSGAGFDKVLQNAIVTQNKRIAFTDKAIVYDEKTSKSDQLVKQRARWINTWFKYFTFGFGLVAKGVTNFSFNQFLFGLVLLRPPLFIFLIVGLLCMLANIFIAPIISLFWAIGFVLFVLSFVMALIISKADKRIYKSLQNIPKFIFFQILSLLKVHKANQVSVATQHYTTEEILETNTNKM